MSLTSVIESYVTGTYPVYRTSESEYDENGRLIRSPSIDADVVSVDFAANTLKMMDHGLHDGSGPLYLSTDNTLPAPLSVLTPYWAIVSGDDDIQLADSFDHAVSATPIDLQDAGLGTHHVASYFMADLSIQPAGGGIKDNQEGQHTEATYTVWSTVEIKSREDGYEADVILIDGERHRVDSVDHFGILSNHWKATLTREATP